MRKIEFYGGFHRKKGIRLTAEMSPLLGKYFYGADKGTRWKGLQMFDNAHTVMLTEEGIIPKQTGVRILKALRQMESGGVQKVREELDNPLDCGEGYVTSIVGPELGGWMNCGRSYGDLGGVAYRVDTRDAIIATMKELINIRKTFLEKAEEHIDTIMPGYSHLQHAEPITFGFYLVSWVHQFERDFERFRCAYKHTNISPAGCAILTTTDFPINRKRTQELLGFDDMYTNARDAIWTIDYLEETLSAFMGMIRALSRAAGDLDIWHTSEFCMVEHPDAFCGSSYIMPQKKNAYGAECIRWLNANVLGNVMTFIAATNRNSDSGEGFKVPICLFHAFESCLGALQIMNGIVKDAIVHRERMRERTEMFWAQASTLANMIVREKEIPFRLAHDIVGVLVKMTYDEGKKPKDVDTKMLNRAAKKLGVQPLNLSEETLRKALDPAMVVRSKKIIGGTAPERVKEDITSSFERMHQDKEVVAAIEVNIATAEKKLRAAIDRIIGEHRQ